MAQNISDYQIKYNDLILGRGTFYGIKSINGLFDVDVESGSVPIPRGDGNIPGQDFLKSKNIELELIVEADKQSDLMATRINRVRAAFQRSKDPIKLFFKTPGAGEQFVLASPIGRAIQEDVQSEHGLKPILIRLHASDPRIYSTDSSGLSMGVHIINSGGTEFPMDFDLEFLATGISNLVRNEGNAKAYPVITFGGPEDAGTIEAVKITNETTGQEIEITTTILSGQVLKADMFSYIRADGDQVIGLGGSSRYADWVLPRTPFHLQPGDNILRYEISAGTSTKSTVTITWFDTSI